MSFSHRHCSVRALLVMTLAALAALLPALAARAAGGGSGLPGAGPGASGGAAVGGLAPTSTPPGRIPGAPGQHAHGAWLGGVTVTEYWPAPESWFVGRLVKAPGLPGLHRIDWLYSAMGLSMEGDGIGLDGRSYHIEALGDGGWVTVADQVTDPGAGWAGGSPYWRAGGFWRNGAGGVTFPLQAGGWSAGRGRKYVPLRGVTFAPGPSLPLHAYQSIAVDPGVIPLGSRVYIPAYRHDGHGGWFLAQDTGGAINGRHIDVYRSPPASSSDSGQYLTGQRIYVIKPHR
jgi:3D (Asp-Asp-Asp) domain-containing protein